MSVLYRTLLRDNLIYLCICLFCCIGIYLLIDVFERLEDFLGAGVSLELTLAYFLLKTPLIVSQILPAVFLLALLVQLSLMKKNRELLALESGGVSFNRVIIFFLVYSLLWVLIQLVFSQFLGVMGQQKSERIWDNLGKDKVEEETVEDIWFRQGKVIVSVDRYIPASRQLKGLKLFYLQEGFSGIEKIVSAARGKITEDEWLLQKVEESIPGRFTSKKQESLEVRIDKSAESFIMAREKEDAEKMSLWKLGNMIKGLERAGVNLEVFLTTWHMKIAYAFSILVLTLTGLCISRLWENVFLNISVGVVMIFIYYGVYVMGGGLGKNGVLPPWFAGWMGVIVLGSASVIGLLLICRNR